MTGRAMAVRFFSAIALFAASGLAGRAQTVPAPPGPDAPAFEVRIVDDTGGGDALPTDTGPSLFTALQEQLGLRLRPERGPVEVLVIDRIEPPSPD